MSKSKNLNSPLKSQFGRPLGFRTGDHFKGKVFSGKGGPAAGKFNPSTFKTQHKG